MHHASEWFDSWQAECYKTPDALTIDSYQKLYQKCEDWARKKRLDADAHNVNMDISGVDGGKSSEEDFGYFDEKWQVDSLFFYFFFSKTLIFYQVLYLFWF